VRIASCWVHPGSPCCPLTLLVRLHFLFASPLHLLLQRVSQLTSDGTYSSF
jgi:hypothetical protein